MDLAALLNQRLNDINMSQKELANKTGIPATTITGYCKGRREPDLKTLERIAGAMDTDIPGLLAGLSSAGRQVENGEEAKFAGQLFAAYGEEPPSDYTEDDFEDLALYIKMVEMRKRRKKSDETH